MLGTNSTSLYSPRSLLKKLRDCEPFSNLAEPGGLLISTQAAEKLASCRDPLWLLRSVQAGIFCAVCWGPHWLLRSLLAAAVLNQLLGLCQLLPSLLAAVIHTGYWSLLAAESHLLPFLVLSYPEAFQLCWIFQYSGWWETGAVLFSGTLKIWGHWIYIPGSPCPPWLKSHAEEIFVTLTCADLGEGETQVKWNCSSYRIQCSYSLFCSFWMLHHLNWILGFS